MAAIKPMAIKDFRLYVADLYAASGRAASTRGQLDHVLRLAERAGCRTTADLTTASMARIVLARGDGANPNTTRGLLARLRRCCTLAIRARRLDRDAAPDWPSLRPRPVPPTRNRPHSAAEVARLLDHLAGDRGSWAGRRLHALTALVAYTGLRRSEALHLRAEDLDLDRGFVFVLPRARLKTQASAAPVPLPEAVVPVLRDWLPHCGRAHDTTSGSWAFPGARREGPWVGGAPGYRPADRLRRAGEAAGVPAVGFHSLRHSLATQLLLAGTPVWAIARVLRHTSPIATAHYLHPSDHQVATWVREFRYA